ncbi:hypothetical protein FACS189445_5090 [Spirochaetia bacterium]|nr:hypothetical protein FACS189445_5090 [Spirochaetia bacterium]
METLFPHNPELRRRQSYAFFESSHREQRAYIDDAVRALPEALKNEALAAFKNLEPERPRCLGDSLFPGDSFDLGPWYAGIGDSGAIVSLQDHNGRELAAPVTGIGEFVYQTFSYEDYVRYQRDYNRDMDRNINWAGPDFGKPGMQYAQPRPLRQRYRAHVRALYRTKNSSPDFDEVTVSLGVSAKDPRGAPQKLSIRYRAYTDPVRLEVTLDWFDKEATRLPEAMWLSFNFNTAIPGRWRFSKLGALIDPLNVVRGGNRSYHGIEWAEYHGYDGAIRITPLDTPLAALGERKLLCFDDCFENPAGGIHFNLYNNIWGTNFPQWYEEDGRSRFSITF